jgi:hypothetical protein
MKGVVLRTNVSCSGIKVHAVLHLTYLPMTPMQAMAGEAMLTRQIVVFKSLLGMDVAVQCQVSRRNCC